LPTEAINEQGIDYSKLIKQIKDVKFTKTGDGAVFYAPNLIIWENIGKEKIPVFYNKVSFTFQRNIIGIISNEKNKSVLRDILNSFDLNNDFYRFYVFVTSGQILINKNTVLLKKDLSQLRFMYGKDHEIILSELDNKIIADVNNYYQDFIRHGEKSKILKPIEKQNIKSVLMEYGNYFIDTLNFYYKKNIRRFRLSDIAYLDNNLFFAAVFRYDSKTEPVKFHNDLTSLNIEQLAENTSSSHLFVNRTIRLYPQKDMVVLVKPNQYKYWISLSAYRDADKYLSDLVGAGF
jgi:hypothetical protein